MQLDNPFFLNLFFRIWKRDLSLSTCCPCFTKEGKRWNVACAHPLHSRTFMFSVLERYPTNGSHHFGQRGYAVSPPSAYRFCQSWGPRSTTVRTSTHTATCQQGLAPETPIVTPLTKSDYVSRLTAPRNPTSNRPRLRAQRQWEKKRRGEMTTREYTQVRT